MHVNIIIMRGREQLFDLANTAVKCRAPIGLNNIFYPTACVEGAKEFVDGQLHRVSLLLYCTYDVMVVHIFLD